MKQSEKFQIEGYIRRNRVFILGAGFSAEAGIPLTASLLEKTMRKFATECPGIFERVDGYVRESIDSHLSEVDYSEIDFSTLCTYLEYIELREYGGGERWSNSGSREKLALRFYLAKTIAECTPTPSALSELYQQFAEQLHNRDIVISFNWDGLLEVALQRLGKPYTYNFRDDEAIKLCKLHGSVNWRLGEPSDLRGPRNTLGWESLDFAQGLIDVEIYHTSKLLEFKNWERYRPLGELEPFLVLPGYGKAFDVRSNAVLWYKPEFAFSTTHDVFIVGLSLAPDDFFIQNFFLSNLPFISSYSGVEGRHIYIINPDLRAEENYQFVLTKGHATLINEPFAVNHLELMKTEI
jgi:hypothetical protein